MERRGWRRSVNDGWQVAFGKDHDGAEKDLGGMERRGRRSQGDEWMNDGTSVW